MKKLNVDQMETLKGGAYIDCFFMVAGFAGAVAASSTGVGILFGALSFAGGVRSAMSCENSSTWFYVAQPTGGPTINGIKLSGSLVPKATLMID